MDTKGMVGACFGLFLLAIVERWVTAIREVGERVGGVK
jgi:hypothetical protein